jgi:hypothetical protein
MLCASMIKSVLQALRPSFAGRANLIFLKPAPAGCHLHAASLQIVKYECTVRHLGNFLVGMLSPAAPEQVQHRTVNTCTGLPAWDWFFFLRAFQTEA